MKHWVLMLFVLGACTDKYVANIKGQATGFLVVEGYINITGTTNIQMSRSTGLDSPVFITGNRCPGGNSIYEWHEYPIV